MHFVNEVRNDLVEGETGHVEHRYNIYDAICGLVIVRELVKWVYYTTKLATGSRWQAGVLTISFLRDKMSLTL